MLKKKETPIESEKGKVLSQSIPEGTNVEQKTQVTIEVGKYAPKLEQPQTTNPGNTNTNGTTDGNTTTPTTGTTKTPATGTTPSTEKTPKTGTAPSTPKGPWDTTTTN